MSKFLISIVCLLTGCVTAPIANAANGLLLPCLNHKTRLETRSTELSSIVKADQDDRENWEHKSQEEMFEVQKRDLIRRKRVGEIFGEGCFSKAQDYAAAALVFQHGDTPDQYFQTFLWSKRAVELGDPSQKKIMAWGLDRYLVAAGQKQLFGSQYTRPNIADPHSCFCIYPVERSFPDKLRSEYTDRVLPDYFAYLKKLNDGKICPNNECDTNLKASPQGTVPRFW